jgi:hypothetical protein
MKLEQSESAPAWLVPSFLFIVGFFLAMAIFRPIPTPEYQRGHRDGYQAGAKDSEEFHNYGLPPSRYKTMPIIATD